MNSQESSILDKFNTMKHKKPKYKIVKVLEFNNLGKINLFNQTEFLDIPRIRKSKSKRNIFNQDIIF